MMNHRWRVLFAICWCLLLFAGPAAAQSVEVNALNNQVTDLYRQGKYAEALEISKMALDIAQNDLGPNHPDVARALSNQALVYRALGQNALAEPLEKRAQAIMKKAPAPAAQSPAVTVSASASAPPAAPAAQDLPPAEPCVRGSTGDKAPKYNDLITAVMQQDAAAVKELLDFGKWIDAQSDDGFTPVMVAARLDDLKIAQQLLACGANPNYRNQQRKTALDYARENRSDRMANLLRKYGARDQ